MNGMSRSSIISDVTYLDKSNITSNAISLELQNCNNKIHINIYMLYMDKYSKTSLLGTLWWEDTFWSRTFSKIGPCLANAGISVI